MIFRGARAGFCCLLAAGVIAGCSTPPGGGSSLPSDMPVRPVAQPWSTLDTPTLRRNIAQLLPAGVKDRAGWAADLHAAFLHLKLPQEPPLYCAVIAVVEQESTFQADPVVPGLPAIVWRELEERGGKYGVPRLLIEAAMLKTSPDGRSYKQRVDSVRTEKEVSDIYEDMIAEIPFGKRLLTGYNPVHTGGPMQVSVDFAEQHTRDQPYPYPIPRTLRDEVFTRRGGLYFGTAILLDYPVPYDDVVYRFADFNAGRFSSRNAAFQQAVGRLSGKPLASDGDLLRYKGGKPAEESSSVEAALRSVGGRLGLSSSEIRRDLLLEKTAEFPETPLFKRVFSQADEDAGQRLPRQAMPEIDLKSPKITRKLTTEWFARRVEGRFRTCLGRIGGG